MTKDTKDKIVRDAEKAVVHAAGDIYRTIKGRKPLDGGEISLLCDAYENLDRARKLVGKK